MGYDICSVGGDRYFRFSLMGLAPFRDYMAHLGMLNYDAEPTAPQPRPGATDGEWNTWANADSTGNAIPQYKLCSNDGWLINEREIAGALRCYDVKVAREVVWEDDWPRWKEWIAFLRFCSKRGGFKVF